MTAEIHDSRKVGFLSKSTTELGPIASALANTVHIDAELRGAMLKNIDSIVGSQEAEWIARNPPDRVVEYLIHRYKFKNYPRLKKLEAFPLHLLIEPTPVCNLRCVMCFQRDITFSSGKEYQGFIDFDFFKELIDQAVENKCGALTLASRGEPTLHPRFGDMLRYCKGKFLELKINTNATRLTEDLCDAILESGVDIVVFSVDSQKPQEYEKIRVGGEFGDTLNNIKRFCEKRNSKKAYIKTCVRVSGVFLGTQNKENFLDFWRGMVDTVAFADAIHRWDTYGNNPSGAGGTCGLLWERIYVWFDGVCNPCDYDYKSSLAVGNAKNTSLKDIWTSDSYNKYRQAHLTMKRGSLFPCDRCDRDRD